ncbi:MAG: sigma-70 family RNA polymerase sigma factor [Planctomycetota bacterium]
MLMEVRNLNSTDALRRLGQTHDAQAWVTLLETHGRGIFATCRNILGETALAEDASQETLLQIREHAVRFKVSEDNPEASARGWIMRIAYNTALQMLRSRQSAQRREDDYARDRSVNAATESAHANAENLQVVQQELSKMAEYDRWPILLHFYENMDYEQLSAALNCSVGAAKVRVHRGIKKLRKRLALLGLLLSFEGFSELMASSVQAAETTPPITAQQQAQWQSLLTSSRQPAYKTTLGKEGGLSLMAKISLTVAALAIIALAVFTVANIRGADTTSKVNSHDAQFAQNDVARAISPRIEETKADAGDKPAPLTVIPTAKATPDELAAVSRGNNQFALDLFAKLQTTKGNLFFSPYSVSTALGMTWAGTRGETAKQMTKALSFSLQPERQHAAFAALIQSLNAETTKDGKKRGFQLSVANRLFGQKGYSFVPEFLALNKNLYGAPLQELDFKKETEAARLTINKWVEEKTREKIKDLIPQGQLTPDVKLVLTNAIYFKGLWTSPFKKKLTQDAPFTLAGGAKVQAPMMQKTLDAGYFEIEGRLQALELPYEGNEISMVVLLPATADGLSDLENDLTADNLKAWTGHIQKTEVEVSLPRFKITWGTFDLVPNLKSLGMTDAFDDKKADFTGMTTHKDLSIGLVLHKAFVDVYEEGTEAAAATAVVGWITGPKHMPKIFCADRPFRFLIREKATGSILFLGRMADPRGI